MSLSPQFVWRDGERLLLGDDPFRIAGANVYYLGYVEPPVIASVLDLAGEMSLNVLRIWAYGLPFHSWDEGRGSPAVKEGPDGLERLDQAVALASERGIRLILTLANYWKDFGGMPEYLRWYGLKSPDQFYRDGRCRAAYWLLVETLLNRTNRFTGRVYKEEPCILAWELANEPRCPDVADGREVLLSWIWEMATLLKAHAPNQLVAVGDEGYFYRQRAGRNSFFNGTHGVDFEAILGVTPVDFGTYHLYGGWAEGNDVAEFGRMWIREHCEAAKRADKPVLLEEYGALVDGKPLANDEQRAAVYDAWLTEVEQAGALGHLLWMLGLPKGPGQPYDPDGYVIGEDPVKTVVRAHARKLLQV